MIFDRWTARLSLTAACAAVVLSITQHARAESGVAFPEGVLATIRRPATPIPADGALLLVSFDGTTPIVQARAAGAPIEGQAHSVGHDEAGTLYAWVPSAPFAVGTVVVTLRNELNAALEATYNIDVVAPLGVGTPELDMRPTASVQAMSTEGECCRNLQGQLLLDACFEAREQRFVLVTPRASSSSSAIVLNQHVFMIGADPGSSISSSLYRPLDQAPLEVSFHEPADQYCVQARAMNVATRAVHRYTELAFCASFEGESIGERTVQPDPSALALPGCLAPPAGYEDLWCEVNADACEPSSDLDASAAHPPGMTDAGHAADPIDASFGPSARASGCTIAPTAHGACSHITIAGLLALASLLRGSLRSRTHKMRSSARLPPAR